MDLKEVLIHDYAVQMDLDGMGNRRNATKCRSPTTTPASRIGKCWKTSKFVADNKKDAGGKWVPVKMTADEQINAAKLDELKTALDDLKIVDVSRKPAGLSADLKVTADFASNAAAVQSLAKKGFYRRPRRRTRPGRIVLQQGRNSPGDEGRRRVRPAFRPDRRQRPRRQRRKEKERRSDKAKEKSTGLNRYLLVMAEFNPDAIPKPQFEKLPEPAKAKEPEKKPGDKAAKDAKTAKKPDEKKPATDGKALEAERARIEKENKRKQEEYDQQIADGKKKVKELNGRFADWYYVISDEVYRKIHLGRDEIVTKKPKKEPEKGERNAGGMSSARPASDQLEKLKSEGPGGK